MKKYLVFLNLFLLSLLFLPGCKKDDSLKNEKGQTVVHGNITLKVRVMHHWWGVPYLPVYLKRNATSWPGTDSTKYEYKVVADNDGNCKFEQLFPGKYYLYAHGYDQVFGMYVTGYHAVELNATTVSNNELDFTLMVSE